MHARVATVFCITLFVSMFFILPVSAQDAAVEPQPAPQVDAENLDITILEPVQFDEHTYIRQSSHDQSWSYYFVYDEVGERAPIERIPGGGVLNEAARYYALMTGDFDISLNDVIEAGLWPYDTFPEDIDLEMKLYGFSGHDCGTWDKENECPMDGYDGTPQWISGRRSFILAMFYGDYFYRIIDATHERSAEIGEKYPQFWINPYTGEEMQEGIHKGDWMPYHVSMWRGNGTGMAMHLEVPDDEDYGLSFAEFTSLADEQNDPAEDQVKVKVDLSTLGDNFPEGGTVSVYGVRSELEGLYENFRKSCLRHRIRSGITMDYDFYVPQINACDWSEEYIGHKFGSK